MKRNPCSFSFRPSALAMAIAGALLSTSSQAADEDIFFSELPVVASVSRLPKPLSEAPGAVTVLDRDMIAPREHVILPTCCAWCQDFK